MPESEGEKQNGQQLCSAETFLFYLGVEMERSRRYNRPFTLVLIQPPDSGDHLDRLQVTWAASEQALGLLRTSDVVAIFDTSAFVVALLPETNAAGARTVFDRFDEQMAQPGEGWMLKLASYPEHAASVTYFLERFSGLPRKSDVETKPANRYADLQQATSDVSRSWRDLTSVQQRAPGEP